MTDAASSAGQTMDAGNIGLFAELAADWWDPDGRSKLLHRVNPCRMAFIREHIVEHFGADQRARRPLAGRTALDVGCGAGLVAEPLARMGATVSAIDAGEEVIAVARDHAVASGLSIDYHAGDLIAFAEQREGRFDLVTCLEVIEHVVDKPLFLAAIARLLKPGGLFIISTPNRTPLSWAVLIAGAEHVVRAIPVGGHDWQQFVTPDELGTLLDDAGLDLCGWHGMSWSPGRGFHMSDDLRVNYYGVTVRSETAIRGEQGA